MTNAEAKTEIVANVQQHTIDVLVNTLAQSRVEVEQLKAQIAELEKKQPAAPIG